MRKSVIILLLAVGVSAAAASIVGDLLGFAPTMVYAGPKGNQGGNNQGNDNDEGNSTGQGDQGDDDDDQ